MRLSIVLIIVAVLFMGVILEALRRRRLSEGYAILWISIGVASIVLALARPAIDWASDSIGISYGPTLVFAAAILVLLIICFNLTIHITRLESRVVALAQEVALHQALADRVDGDGTGPGVEGDGR